MLYKVTPMMAPPQKAKPAASSDAEHHADAATTEPKQPRKRRKSAIFDADGNEVLITMMCLKCKSMKPLAMFGLRKMADGAIRNQPWCRTCRSGASTKKKNETLETEIAVDAPLAPAAGDDAVNEPAASATEAPSVTVETAVATPEP